MTEAAEIMIGWVRDDPKSPMVTGTTTPVTSDEQRLNSLTDSIKSDPFIPRTIRDRIVRYLQDRMAAISEVNSATCLEYKQNLLKDLAEGKELDTTEYGWAAAHNLRIERFVERGRDVEQTEKEVNEIRSEIQDYFESFSPGPFRSEPRP